METFLFQFGVTLLLVWTLVGWSPAVEAFARARLASACAPRSGRSREAGGLRAGAPLAALGLSRQALPYRDLDRQSAQALL
jgi:hypothetical protein